MIEVAKILKPVGLKGELKLEMFSTDENFWENVKTVFVADKEYKVQHVRFYKTFCFVFLENVTTLETAETLRGKTMFVENIEANEEGSYIIDDLVNCALVDENDNLFGYVDSVEKYGSADIINVVRGGVKKSFPFLKQVVKSVDIKNKQIVVFREKIDEVMI